MLKLEVFCKHPECCNEDTMTFIDDVVNKLTKFFQREKISKRGWTFVAIIYAIIVSYRCGLADYAELYGVQDVLNPIEILNKEPTLFYIPISLILSIIAVLYLFTKVNLIEKIFFSLLLFTTLLSISRLIIDFTNHALFIINHCLVLLTLICIFILRMSRTPSKKRDH